MFLENLSIKEATRDGLARVDYTDGTASLLVEPQRTNLFAYSDDFSVWGVTNLTISPNEIISPDGTLNGAKITDNSTDSAHRMIYGFTTPSSGTFTYSIFLKKGTLTTAQIQVFNSGTASSANINLLNGTITDGGQGINHTIENYGNDWYRCSISGDLTSTSTTIYVYANQKPAYIGNGDYLYVWGAQFEQGSHSTSYIKTQGSTVTRNQDVYEKTGISDKINSEEGVLFVEMAALSDDLTNRAVSLSDGTLNNGIQIEYFNVSNRIRFRVYAGGVLRATIQAIGITITNTNKLALKWESGFMTVYINGSILNTAQAIASVPTGLDRLKFDLGQGSSKLLGKVKQLQVFKTALSDSELATLTT
jgi:hypothetical protein